MDRTPLPAFIWTARPLEIPPALIELDPESDVRISNGKDGTGTMLAGDYIKELRETIARQADGFYTTQEASHILAEAVPGMNAIGWQSKFNEAWRSGVLIVRDRTTTKKSLTAAKVDYTDLVKDVDLDAWLKNDGGVYLFPRGKPIAPPAPEVTGQSGGDGIDFAVLANPAQLIAAFGRFTGMDASWFDKWADYQVLSNAIKVKGTSGRGRTTKPLFCPFLVMQGLMKKPRKGSNRRAFQTTEKPWELLKRHFANVYATHQGLSPLDD